MIKQRNWLVVVILSFITFGIYGLYWLVKTKTEMKELGADIPTAWLLIIPFVNFYWVWKYAHGYEHITNGETNGILIFVLYLVFFPAVQYLVQTELNKHVAGNIPLSEATVE